MPIRVVDPKVTKEIDVSGSKVIIKSLNVSQKQKIAFAINEKGLLNVPIEDFIDPVADGVVSIEGQQGNARDVLLNLESLEDFWQIVGAVLNFSSLNEEEEKNSPSSSDVEKTSSARDAETIVKPGEKPVSTTAEPKP